MEDLNKLRGGDKKSALKAAQEIIKEMSIVKDKENLWNVDEAHFLTIRKPK